MKSIARSLLSTTCMTAAILSLGVPHANANPEGGTISAGQASIAQSGKKLDVHQQTDKVVIDWRGFDIEADEHTQFHQPSSSSLALNRVNSTNASRINGQLSANGNVVIVNQNGIAFGSTAKVDVNGLVATTADIDNDKFMQGGAMHFDKAGNPNAAIINEGTITAREAGLVGLVAPKVSNSGTIKAKLGKVHLASGDKATIDLYGDKLIEVEVSDAVNEQLISNSGAIEANGGSIHLTAAAGRQVVNSLIQMDGSLTAQSVAEHNGDIVIGAEGSNAVENNIAANKGLKSGYSTVLVSGTIDASGKKTGERGGKVKITADRTGIMRGAKIDASGDVGGGTVLVGGDYLGGGTTPNALRTIVQGETLIQANSLTSGNGGKVIIWADERTTFAGTIEASALGNSGNGGFVETSGKDTLDVFGRVTASSLNGLAGTWLLDPNDVTISTSATASPGYSANWTAVGNGNVNTTDIVNSLNSNTNVTITASGSITVQNNIAASVATGNAPTLALSAGTDITVNTGVSIGTTVGPAGSNGKLNVTFTSNTAAAGGYIRMASGSSITTNGGNITFGGGGAGGAAVGRSGAGNIIGIGLTTATLNACLDSCSNTSNNGGTISMIGLGYNGTTLAHGISVSGGTIQTNGTGTISLTGTGGNTTTGYGVTLLGSGTMSAVNGNTLITGTGVGSTVNNYGVYVNGYTVETVGTGTLTLVGKGGGGTSTSGANNGVMIDNSSIIRSTASSGGAIHIVGYAGGTGAGGGNVGVRVTASGTQISSVDGNIVIAGNNVSDTSVSALTLASLSGANNYGVQLDTSGGTTPTILTSGNANVIINGTGIGSGATSYGVYLLNAGATAPLIRTNGTGTTTLNGVLSGTTTYGIFASGSSRVNFFEMGGNLTLNSTQDIGLTNANISYTNSAAPNVVLAANYNSGSPTNGAINITTSSITTNGGNITLGGGTSPSTMSAVGNATNTAGVSLSGATFNASGSSSGGTITITGTGYATTTSKYGVAIQSVSTITTSHNGGVTITGTGGNGTNTNYGVYINGLNTTYISTASGNINITGTGGGNGTGNSGIYINGGATVPYLRTTGGSITLTGTQAGSTTLGIVSTSSTAGDFIQAGGAVTIRSNRDVSLTRSHITYSGSAAPNVLIQSDMNSATPTNGAILLSSSNITTNGGYIRMGGGTDPFGNSTGAVGNSTNVVGVNLTGSALNAGGSGSGGNVWIKGTGYAGTSNNYGVAIQTVSTVATSHSGTITINGTGGAGSSNGNAGVVINGLNTTYITSASGAIDITGTGAGSGGTSYGISISGGATAPYIRTTGGSITLTGTYGGTTTYGILSTSTTAGDIIQAGGNVIIRSNRDISLTRSHINYSDSNAPNVLIQSDMNSATPTNGAIILSSSNITTNGGYIRMGGGTDPFGNNTAAMGNVTNVHGINISGGTLNAGGGNIWMKGMSYAGTATNYGVFLQGATALTTSSTGTMTISGDSQGTTTANYGIYISGNSVLTMGTGDMLLTGNASGTTLEGIYVNQGAATDTFKSEGGAVSLHSNQSIRLTNANFTSPGSNAFNVTINSDRDGTNGGRIQLTTSNITTSGGNIIFGGGTTPSSTATLGVSGAVEGVNLSGSALNASGASSGGSITINGTGYAGTSSNYGVYLLSASTITTSHNGGITITGTGGAGSGNANRGVYLSGLDTTYISTANGHINITGTGGGAGTTNYGIGFNGGATIPYLRTTGGNITLTGTQAGTTTYGVYSTSTTAGDFIKAGGSVTLKSNRDIGFVNSNITYTASNSPNVLIQTDMNSATPTNGAFSAITSNITTNGGWIRVGGGTDPFGNNTGTVGNATNAIGILLNGSVFNAGSGDIWMKSTGYAGVNNNYGIQLQVNSGLQTSGSGSITLVGTGGSGTAGNYGVYLSSSSAISSFNGAINITGTGAGTTTTNHGIYILTSGISSTGNGNITLTGTGAGTTGMGVNLTNTTNSSALLSANSGDISVTGTGSGASDVTLSGFDSSANVSNASGTTTFNGLGTTSSTGLSLGSAVAMDYYHVRGWTLNTASNLAFSNGIAKTTGGDDSWTLSVPGNISFAGNAGGIRSTSGKLNITLLADNDGVNAGTILVNFVSALVSNGGNITLSGGTDPYATTGATKIDIGSGGTGGLVDARGSSSGGDIVIRAINYVLGTSNFEAISMGNSSTIVTNYNGDITMSGINTNTGSDKQVGIGINRGSASIGYIGTEFGDINITAVAQGTHATSQGFNAIASGASLVPLIQTKGGEVNIYATSSLNGHGWSLQVYRVGTFIESGGNVTIRTHGDLTITGSTYGASIVNYGSSTINVLLASNMNDLASPTNGSLNLTGNITTNGGNVTIGSGTDPIASNGAALASNNINGSDYGVVVGGNIDVTKSGGNGGNIWINGKGKEVVTSNGVVITSALTTNGSGTITVIGNGPTSGLGSSIGVTVTGTISTEHGALTVNGTGGTGGTTGNHGVYITGRVENTGNAAVTVTGNAGTAGYGVYANGGVITGVGGSVTINGTGSASTQDRNYGVLLEGTSALSNTGTGTLTINATAGGASNSGNNYGMYTRGASLISTDDGTLTINATGGGSVMGTGGHNHGLYTEGTLQTTGSGAMIINAQGGNTSATDNTYGMYIRSGIAALGTGSITVNSTAGNCDTGSCRGIVLDTGSITGHGGAMNITGNGAPNSNGTFNYGIHITSATGGAITNSGAGTLTLNGNGGGGTDFNYGVRIDPGAVVSTENGLLTVNGQGGGTGAGATNYGVSLRGLIETTGTGNIVVSGTGGNTSATDNYGINFDTGIIQTPGGGTIAITGNGGNGSIGVNSVSGTNIIGHASAGDISIVANLISLTDTTVQTPGSLLMRSTSTLGDLTLESGTSLIAGDSGIAITLSSGRNFINNAGAGVLSTPSGVWRIYSANPEGDVPGGLESDFSKFSCTYGGACNGSGNGFIFAVSNGSNTPDPDTDPTPDTFGIMDVPSSVIRISQDGGIEHFSKTRRIHKKILPIYAQVYDMEIPIYSSELLQNGDSQLRYDLLAPLASSLLGTEETAGSVTAESELAAYLHLRSRWIITGDEPL